VEGKLPQIVAIKGKNVEGVELDFVVVLAAIEAIEIRDAVNAEQHGFTVDYKLACLDSAGGLDDQRISAAPVVAVAREQSNPVMVTLHDEAEAIVFYFMKPTRMVGNLGSACGDEVRRVIWACPEIWD
jgi:hypothetical protein